eukprot:gb/GECH01008739.1/.p1 GENE.gb/GECH01008739.1/~~gb/GECH01008739.1/.p1  ORF type:complete len:700 (+),score=109.25 gb/GECH01008739.1/:1-2100(+)
MEELAENHSAWFLPVTDAWVDLVHSSSPSDFFHAYSHAYNMFNRNGTGAEHRRHANRRLRKICADNVDCGTGIMSNKTDTFPGPMAVQMGRKHITTIQNNDYYITEKSDGIRVMMLVLHKSSFPRWGYQNGSGSIQALDLLDSCALETAYIHLTKQTNDHSHPGIELTRDYFSSQTPSSSFDPNNIHQVSFDSQQKTISNNQGDTIQLVRETGWTFAYAFDRNYNFYLCSEEFAFPTERTKKYKNPVFQNVLLLDGEVVYNHRQHRYNYTIYDIVTFCEYEPDQPHKVAIKSCLKMPMSKRKDIIQYHVVEAHHCFYGYNKLNSPKSLQILLKHFYQKRDLEQVISFIQRDPTSGEYFYKKYNKNDGLIFTPNSIQLYPFQPGTCNNLIKWKWPEKLTADWLVIPLPNGQTVTDAISGREAQFSLFYYGCKQPIYYRDAHVEGITKEDMQHINNNQGGILECDFDRQNGVWRKQTIRKDKNTANAFYVIASTLENIIEELGIDELKHCVIGSPKTTVDSRVALVYDIMSAREDCSVWFKVGWQVRDDRKTLKLQYLAPVLSRSRNAQHIYRPVSGHPMRDVHQHYYKIANCVDRAENHGEQLAQQLACVYDNVTRGGDRLYVRCAYDALRGVWQILEYNTEPSREQLCHGRRVLETLERVAMLSYRNANSPSYGMKRPREDEQSYYEESSPESKRLRQF